MSATLARRLVLPAGEGAELCRRLGLHPPPGFPTDCAAELSAGLLLDGDVHGAMAAGLAAACAPDVGVLLSTTVADTAAAFGVRRDLGGALVRNGDRVELSAWPAERLGAELGRGVPGLGTSPLPALHLPLPRIATHPSLREAVVGTLTATVLAPPSVVGQVRWLATSSGWLALEPAESRDGVRWATVRPVGPADLGASLAGLVAAAIA